MTADKIELARRCVNDASIALTLGDYRLCEERIKHAIKHINTNVRPIGYSVSVRSPALMSFRLADAQVALSEEQPAAAEYHLRLALSLFAARSEE